MITGRVLVLTVLTVTVVFSAVLRPAAPAPAASRNWKLSVFQSADSPLTVPPPTPTSCVECCTKIRQSGISHVVGIVMAIYLILWPAFVTFKWAKPWDSELEAINRIH